MGASQEKHSPFDIKFAEAERLRRDERTKTLVKKNLLFLLGAGLIVFSSRYVSPVPHKSLLFSFGVAAILGAFVWQIATKE